MTDGAQEPSWWQDATGTWPPPERVPGPTMSPGAGLLPGAGAAASRCRAVGPAGT